MITKKYNYSIFSQMVLFCLLTMASTTDAQKENKTFYEKAEQMAQDAKEKAIQKGDTIEHEACLMRCPGYFSDEISLKKSCCKMKCKLTYGKKRVLKFIEETKDYFTK